MPAKDMYIIADDEDNLYVATETNDFRKPIRRRSLFLCKLPYSKVRPFGFISGTPCEWDRRELRFYVTDRVDGKRYFLDLVGGKSPPSTYADEWPILLPKLRKGTRAEYKWGAWRYQFAKMWIPIDERVMASD